MLNPLEKLRRWRRQPTHTATIDTATAAPPPSPLAPVDLANPDEVAAVMDLAARIGDILLSSGTANSDTKAQIHAVTSAYGLFWCHVDITLNSITIFTHMGTQRRSPLSVFRVVRRVTTDFSKLSDVDRLIRSIQAGATPPEVAEQILNEIETRPTSFGPGTALLGWGIMGGAVAVMLGGTLLMGAVAFCTSLLVMGINLYLDRHSLPLFFQCVFAGFVATMPATLAYGVASHYGIEMRPSQVIASGIVVMLAGLTLVQSLQDGITGAPVTASARFFETLLYTGGIVAGVGMGIEAAGILGVHLPAMESLAPVNFQTGSVRVITGAVASAGFAIACYAEWSAVSLAALAAGAGGIFYYYLFVPFGLGPVMAGSLAAVIIGLAGGLLARRFQVPPLIIAIAGITPLLPGLSVYRGMYSALNEQMVIGFTAIAMALATACGLAAGVVLGEWIARRIRRPKRFNPYLPFRVARGHSFSHVIYKVPRVAARAVRRR